MGFSYRKRRGPITFSASRRGPRVSIGFGGGGGGCLIACLQLTIGLSIVWYAVR